MADYTIVVDDSDPQIVYGPDGDTWSAIVNGEDTFQSTSHYTTSPNATLSLSFVGGKELLVRGSFAGDNSAAARATYPIFQVDLNTNIPCTPGTPLNDGLFFCTGPIPSEIINRTLTMFFNPDAAMQPFEIDYIRYGSSSQVAESSNGTLLFVRAPDNHTPELSFQGNWETGSPQTVTPSSKATYSFVGSNFAWYNCCMSSGASGNPANVSYSFDSGESTTIMIDERFIEGPYCQVQRLLFQSQIGQLDSGNHTVEIVYNGDRTKMPLSICSLSATPLDFSVLDPRPVSDNNPPSSSPTPTPPTATPTTSRSTLSSSSTEDSQQPAPSLAPSQNLPSGVIAGIVACGVVIFLLMLVIAVMWWRKRRGKLAESRISGDELLPRAYPILMATERDQSAVIIPSSRLASKDSSASRNALSESRMRSVTSPSIASELASRPPSYCIAGSSTLS